MVIADPVLHDGFVEREMAFVSDSAPIIKLRAVLTIEGKYKPIVRDFATGSLLVDGGVRYNNPQDCLRAAEHLAINFITENIERVVPL